MSTNISQQVILESKEDADYNKICEQHKHLVETLPAANGWRTRHIYNYNGFWINPFILKNNLLIHTYFEFQPTDIILASFVKSGTTWLKALMFSIVNRNDCSISDHHLLHHGPHSTVPFLDIQSYPISDFTHHPPPRLFSTHFAHTLLPQRMGSCKFVYVCRHPKDVFVSKWLFMSKLRSKDLPPLMLDDAFESFCQGVSEYGPIWEHVLSYWRASLDSPDKILFLKYEDIKKEPEVVLSKLAMFMGKPFTEEEEEKGVIKEIVKFCSFENLSNLEVNKKGVLKINKISEIENKEFFRKGEIGDWKNYLSAEMKDRIDQITNQKLKGSGLILGSRV